MSHVNAHLGPAVLHGRDGSIRFRPHDAFYEVSPSGVKENPAIERTGRRLLAGRLFVGFNVKGAPRWSVDDVIDIVAGIRRGGATFIVQRGIYSPLSGPRVEEESVQILIFNDEGLLKKDFTNSMIALAEKLCVELEQDEVYLDVQNKGVTIASYSVTAV